MRLERYRMIKAMRKKILQQFYTYQSFYHITVIVSDSYGSDYAVYQLLQ